MENTSDYFMPRPLLFCMKSEKSVCYSVPDNTVWFAAGGASNAIPIQGTLPRDTQNVISVLNRIINSVDENDLRNYRKNLRHL